jgi:acyl transferase domain-containing protein
MVSQIAQICTYIFIFQYSMCTWLESLGIHARAVLGHSLEEIAAAGMSASHVAGFVFSYRYN